MSFKLQKLELENFMSFVARTTISFSSTNINNIEGTFTTDSAQSNGAGKSSIIDAISLALFGKGVRETYITSYISDSNPTGGFYLGLELIDENSNILKIERWRRKDSEINKAKLWYNSKCISTDSTISKIDELIQSYIGVSHTNFLSCIFSVMLPGFLKLRPASRFEILEQALALKKIDSVIKKINNAIKEDEDKLEATKEALNEKRSILVAEETKKNIYETNADSIKLTIEKYKEELANLLNEENNHLTDFNKWHALLLEITDKVSSIQQTVSLTTAEIFSIDSEVKKLQLKLKTTLSAIRKNTSGIVECAICKSSLSDASKDNIKKHYQSEIDLLLENKKIKENELVIAEKKKEKILLTKNKIDEGISSISRKLNATRSDLLSVERSLTSSKTALLDTQGNFNPEILIAVKKDIHNLLIGKKTLENSLKINNAWKQAMSKNGLRLSYIKEEVSTLSAIASKYASAVYEQPMAVKFYINEDKDTPALDFSVNGKSATMKSTGERGRLEIALTLSLLSLLKTAGMNLEFLVLDEMLDGLSMASKHSVLKVINSISTEYQILMISHDPLIKTLKGHTIQICKESATNSSSVKIIPVLQA